MPFTTEEKALAIRKCRLQARATSVTFQLLKATFAEQAEKVSPVHKFQC